MSALVVDNRTTPRNQSLMKGLFGISFQNENKCSYGLFFVLLVVFFILVFVLHRGPELLEESGRIKEF